MTWCVVICPALMIANATSWRACTVSDLVADYGHLVVDECHHVSARSFELVARRAKAKFVTGLSATVARKDGRHPIIFLQCGPVRYRVNARRQAAERPFAHHVLVRPTGFLPAGVADDDKRVEFQRLCAAVMNSEPRNRLIVDEIVQAVKAGRSPVVLTERTEHLEVLAQATRQHIAHVIALQGRMGRKPLATALDLLKTIPAGESRVIISIGRFIGDLCGTQRLFHRHVHSVELVVARHFFDELATAPLGRRVLEHDEVPHQFEKPALCEHAFQHHLQLGQLGCGVLAPSDCAPGLEPLLARVERTDARLHAVRSDQHRVGSEERGDLRLVGLELLVRAPYGCILVGRVLEFDHCQRQSVDEQHHVGPASVLPLGDSKLIDGEPVVVGGYVEIDHPCLVAGNGTVRAASSTTDSVNRGAVISADRSVAADVP